MTTLRRSLGLVATAIALVLGVSAVTSAAQAYPPGQKAQIALSATRVSHGATLTISGTSFRPQGRVVITVTCRAKDPDKSFTATYRAKASDGAFDKSITIDPSFPNGRCVVTASTGKQDLNSDRATFFVNTPSQSAAPQADFATRLAGFDSTPTTTAGTGSSSGALLIAGFGIVFLLGGGVLLFSSRRRYAVVRS